jgi:Tfp pilus assembly protein PilX
VRSAPTFRRRDRGFSLLVVFMLIIVMVGAAAAVMLSTQQDLSVSGQDREQLQAFYAAEYAIAMGKDYLAANNVNVYNPTTSSPPRLRWGQLLESTDVHLCTPAAVSKPAAPGTACNDTSNPWTELQGTFFANGNTTGTGPGTGSGPVKAQFRFCFHNDLEDLNFADRNTAGRNGNLDDDSASLLVIEGYGRVIPATGANPQELASARVWVVVGKPSGQSPVMPDCYSQEGGCGTHAANAGAQEAGTTVLKPTGQAPVRGL